MSKRGIVFTTVFLILYVLPIISAQTCKEVHIANRDTEHALDITFVSDFADNDGLKKQAEGLVAVMRANAPFNELIDTKVNIRYVAIEEDVDLECCKIFPFCSQVKVATLSSFCPTDEIIVFSGFQAGSACNVKGVDIPAVGAFGQHTMIVEDISEARPELLLHELGHSMAFLGDEYSYRSYLDDDAYAQVEDLIENQLAFLNFPNCERHPECVGRACTCPKWKNVPGAGCYQGCGFDNWYRDSPADIMTDELGEVGPVDALQYRSAMNRYVDYVKEPMSIEINKKTTDFIIGKFIEKNSEWKEGNIPNLGFSYPLDQLNKPTKSPQENEIINNLGNALLSGLTMRAIYCKNYRVESRGDPKVWIKFHDIRSDFRSADNTIILTLSTEMKISGKAEVSADGTIIGFDPLHPDIDIVKDCDDLLSVDWNSDINYVTIVAELAFSQGALGIIQVAPKVTAINLPRDSIHFSLNEESKAGTVLGFLLPHILDILDSNHFSKSYDFATELSDRVYSFKDELNKNLDEIGLSLKASLDLLGLEQLANMGKPHGMILNFYMQDRALTKGVEVDDNTLRLSGPASFNTPLLYNRASCVKNRQLDFNPIDFSLFERNIPTDQSKFASVRISQTFPNWFIATLWNDGFFCAKKEIPVADNPSFVPEGEFVLTRVNYDITPLSPPYVDYTSLEDTNDDGVIDINHDLVAQGKAGMELRFEYMVNGQMQKESAIIDFSYIVPFQLEEPDLTLPQDQGFTTAQSFFRTDVEHTLVNINTISCGLGVLCDALKLSPYKEALVQEIKENMASHMDRALYEIELNPIRDVNLNFGDGFGSDYFTPGFNLDYGEYIAKVSTRQIDRKWAIYDFDLVEKCGSGEDCGSPGRAKITGIQEVFYKDISCAGIPLGEAAGAGCRCVKKPTEESKACIDALFSAEGKLFHYARIDYAPSRDNDLVAYNFNLINWNLYSSEAGKSRMIFVTESPETYDRLLKSRNEQTEDLDFLEKDANIHKFNVEATQIVAFRAKTLKGVQQGFRDCMAAVIFDTSGDMLDYHLRGVLVKVKPRLRSDINDDYIVCADDQDREGYQTLLPHEAYSPSAPGERT